jgi:hypothetical protein
LYIYVAGEWYGPVVFGSDAPMWTLEAVETNGAAIRHRPLDVTQPPLLDAWDGGGDIAACAASKGLFDACKLLILPIEKSTQTWWRSALRGHPEIDATLVDSTLSVSEYDPETQATIRRIMFDQSQKAAGKPTAEDERLEELYEKAKATPGSPFTARREDAPT